MKVFAGMTSKQAILHIEEEERKLKAITDSYPRCTCGNIILKLYDDQKDDECSACYDKRKKA